jgi:hypothetical protein
MVSKGSTWSSSRGADGVLAAVAFLAGCTGAAATGAVDAPPLATADAAARPDGPVPDAGVPNPPQLWLNSADGTEIHLALRDTLPPRPF